MAMEGPLSRVKSIKKSLRQSFRRIRRSRVSMRKHQTSNAAKVCFALFFSNAAVIHPTNSLNMKLGIMHAVISAAVSIA